MSVYLIAQLGMNDDSWVPDYASHVHDIVHKHNGKYLSRSANVTPLEGDAPADIIAIVQFPTLADAEAFAGDPDYAPYKDARRAGTNSVFCVIDDTDVAGTIPYLAPGG